MLVAEDGLAVMKPLRARSGPGNRCAELEREGEGTTAVGAGEVLGSATWARGEMGEVVEGVERGEMGDVEAERTSCDDC